MRTLWAVAGLLAASCASQKAAPDRSYSAQPVSLMQDRKPIECHAEEGTVWVGKRDRYMKTELGSLTAEYTDIRFMDTGVLFKQKDNKQNHALFHILENGKARLIYGKLSPFRESDCDDIGAAKSCKKGGKTLYWSAERLEFDGLKGDVSRYGHFPNDATYFYMSDGHKSLVLIDYGSSFDLLKGSVAELTCRYPERQ